VSIFSRLLCAVTARRPRAAAPHVRGRLALLALGAILGAAFLQAAPASAFVSAGFGLQRRQPIEAKALVEGGPLQYQGGPVLHSSDAYVVYWDPVGSYRGDWERMIDKYFQSVGAESGTLKNVFALDPQYRDSHGGASNQMTFRGSYKDTDPYPASGEGGNCTEQAAVACLTDRQIRAELQHLITSVNPPLPGATGTPVYYLLTPPGVTVCTGAGTPSTCSNSKQLEEESEKITKGEIHHPAETGICGYHSAVNPGGASPTVYVVQPWVAGAAGLYIKPQNPLVTSPNTPDVLACQDDISLQEPNQEPGLNQFGNYAKGLADVIINDLSIEQRDVVADPLLTGWYQTATDAEQGDVCQFNFGPRPLSPEPPNELTHAASESDNEEIGGEKYYLAWAFDSADVTSGKGFGCWSGDSLQPFFTAPNPVNVGDIVGFNATESDITMAAASKGLPGNEPYLAPVYTWNFGDGSTTASGTEDASEFHSYQYGGSYDVTLTVTDSGGNTESATHEITVNGPHRPEPASAAGAGHSGATVNSSSSQAGAGSANGTVASPTATAVVVSRSLKSALHSGLVVRYSVSEQVAGHFEVLLSRTIARRLGITGTPATGLPAGTPAELVIAKSILVTTKGGRNTVHIEFSKRTAERLQRLHSVSLMLRLIVRNAATHSPASTTVLSTVTLSH